MENTLVEFGVEFLRSIHSGVSRASVRGQALPLHRLRVPKTIHDIWIEKRS
jgi:hypothetical protein